MPYESSEDSSNQPDGPMGSPRPLDPTGLPGPPLDLLWTQVTRSILDGCSTVRVGSATTKLKSWPHMMNLSIVTTSTIKIADQKISFTTLESLICDQMSQQQSNL